MATGTSRVAGLEAALAKANDDHGAHRFAAHSTALQGTTQHFCRCLREFDPAAQRPAGYPGVDSLVCCAHAHTPITVAATACMSDINLIQHDPLCCGFDG